MAQAIVSICLALIVMMERSKMSNYRPKTIEYTVLNNPTKRHKFAEATKFHAIDILYECPKCGAERVYTWSFPSQLTLFKDNCCDEWVEFIPKEEE
jgi:hypothetical protein